MDTDDMAARAVIEAGEAKSVKPRRLRRRHGGPLTMPTT
jgi:hypothetical protein